MKKMLALLCCLGMLAMGANVYADWCTTDGSTINCANPGTYTTWRVGKFVSDASSRVYACANSEGTWYLVGWQDYNSETTLEIVGSEDSELILIADTTIPCQTSTSTNIKELPSDWFDRIEVYGYDGDDELEGSYRDENLYGESGADYINGDAGDDEIEGGAGNDNLAGGDGDDHILGGAGADSIYGNANNDTLEGGADVDLIHGNSGADTITGDSGRDTLYGGTGNDIIDDDSDGSADYLYGESDLDTLYEDYGECYGGYPGTPPGDSCDCATMYECETYL